MSSGWETMSESTISSTTPTSSELSIPSSVLGTPIDERIKRTNDLLKTDTNVVFNAECIKKRSNWSKVNKEHNLVDYTNDPSTLLADIETHSPKLQVLLQKIKSLDDSDMREHGTHFKHLIFTDLKSNSYGVKLIASALIATGMTLGYKADPTSSGKKKFGKIQMLSDVQLEKTKGNNFYLLSSVTVFDQPISVVTKKDILARFNERPNNVHGENVRIMVMDSGFKEGIDLFDIKYIHIFEPPSTAADQKQVIGRGTRTCGQKGLQFHPTMGWPLHVFIYDMVIPSDVRSLMGDVETTFQLYMKAMNLDLRLYAFTGELERATIMGSVDHDLNENIHTFSVSGGIKRKVVIRDDLSPIVIRGDMPIELAFAMAERLVAMPQPQSSGERMNHDDLKKHINENFGQYKWEKAKMENLCTGGDTPRKPPADDSGEKTTGGYVYGGGVKSTGGYVYGGGVKSTGGYVYATGGSAPSCPQSTLAGGLRGAAAPVAATSCPQSTLAGGLRGAAAPVAITLTPTQDFLKHYFVPSNPVKGMLLWHSTGSGKTCSAIAAASNEFEKEGYTILWVTRTTLKNDIWKNMFDQVCHEVIRAKLSANEIAIPSEQPKRMKLLSSSWRIRPMSYKQFSNLVSKRNKLYDTLVKINGYTDPLRKTLIIIDEAHKLYGGGDLSSIERPDMGALQESLMNSYAVSGRNSVRLMLMTATPITTNPMEMIKLINLCKPMGEQMPTDFEDFTNKYLESDSGKFSVIGLKQYLDDTAGYVSYLNREKDARQFSQPVIHQIKVPLAAMDYINAFDKRTVRELVNSDVLKLKDKIENANIEIKGELGDLDVNKFKVLKAECDKYSDEPDMKKACNKIAQKNMRNIVTDAKAEVTRIKDEIKAIRESIKTQKLFKTKNIAEILEKIQARPEEYEKFKEGVYYNMKTKCGKTIRTESELLKEHPDMQSYIYAIRNQDKKEEEMEKMLKLSENSFKLKILELKAMLKTDLNDLERSVVKLVIKDTRKKAKSVKRQNIKVFGEQVIIVNKTLKIINKNKKKQIRSLKTEFKEQLKNEKIEKREIDKAEKQLNKQLRKQDDYVDEIKHGVLKDLVTKYRTSMKDQLVEAKENIEKKSAAKQEKKDQKAAANKTKKLQKDVEKQEKKADKEAMNKTKKLQKETDKQEKKADKEAMNKTKKLQKDTEKQDKKDQNEAANKMKKQEKKDQNEAAKQEKKDQKDTAKQEKKDAATRKKLEQQEKKSQNKTRKN